MQNKSKKMISSYVGENAGWAIDVSMMDVELNSSER
jgi:hypothetical protein